MFTPFLYSCSCNVFSCWRVWSVGALEWEHGEIDGQTILYCLCQLVLFSWLYVEVNCGWRWVLCCNVLYPPTKTHMSALETELLTGSLHISMSCFLFFTLLYTGASFFSSVTVLTKSIVGSAILSMPSSIKNCGTWGGLILLTFCKSGSPLC